MQATINALSQSLERAEIRPSNETDHGYIEHIKCLQKGDLWIGDLGYFRIETFKEIQARNAYYLQEMLIICLDIMPAAMCMMQIHRSSWIWRKYYVKREKTQLNYQSYCRKKSFLVDALQ